MGMPNITFETPVYQINLTVLLSVLSFCLAAMATLIKIFSKPRKPEEMPGTSPHCVHMKEQIQRIEEKQKEDVERLDAENKSSVEREQKLKDIVAELEKEVLGLQKDAEAQNKSLEEIRQSNKEIAGRLDDLLKQLMDFANS
jgi:septal ring factor EnvC (AmiA/AmiB activator)